MYQKLEYLKKIDEKLFHSASAIQAQFDKDYYLEDTKVHIDEESFNHSFVRFELAKNFKIQIEFWELEEAAKQIDPVENYKLPTSKMDQLILKENIKK